MAWRTEKSTGSCDLLSPPSINHMIMLILIPHAISLAPCSSLSSSLPYTPPTSTATTTDTTTMTIITRWYSRHQRLAATSQQRTASTRPWWRSPTPNSQYINTTWTTTFKDDVGQMGARDVLSQAPRGAYFFFLSSFFLFLVYTNRFFVADYDAPPLWLPITMKNICDHHLQGWHRTNGGLETVLSRAQVCFFFSIFLLFLVYINCFFIADYYAQPPPLARKRYGGQFMFVWGSRRVASRALMIILQINYNASMATCDDDNGMFFLFILMTFNDYIQVIDKIEQGNGERRPWPTTRAQDAMTIIPNGKEWHTGNKGPEIRLIFESLVRISPKLLIPVY